MTNADLQNISEIIKIINGIFQGHLPDPEKYKTMPPAFFAGLPQRVERFYQQILLRGARKHQSTGEMRELLLHHYQRSAVLSLSDLRAVVVLLQATPNIVPEQQALLGFLEEHRELFEAETKGKPVKFRGETLAPENLLFAYECRSPSVKELIERYLSVEEPLQDLALVRGLLLQGSNLSVAEAL
ncbi:unnamed protein product [Sphagnum balticum]